MTPQCKKVLRHMNDYGGITQAEATARYGVTRLSARIYDLRAAGIRINSKPTAGTNRYGEPVHFSRYSLADEKPEIIIGSATTTGGMWESTNEGG